LLRESEYAEAPYSDRNIETRHVEDKRHAASLAGATVREPDAVGFDKLRRSGLMGVRNHDQLMVPMNTIVSAISSGVASRFNDTRET
jgi:hypothetical protein